MTDDFETRMKMFKERGDAIKAASKVVEGIEFLRKRATDAAALIAFFVTWHVYGLSVNQAALCVCGWSLVRIIGNRIAYHWSGKIIERIDIMYPSPAERDEAKP